MARWRGVVVGLLAFVPAAGAPLAGQVPWWDGLRIQAAEAREDRHQGREGLLLRNGTVWLEGPQFRDGTIRLDLNAPDALGFYGVAFRAADDDDYEHIYVRPFRSGNPDAVQYTPVFHGVSGWQIYADSRFSGAVPVATDRWIHLEVRVRDGRAELLVDGRAVAFPALQRERAAGAVGITASGAPARFANVVVSRDAPDLPEVAGDGRAEEVVPEEGLIERWAVSTPFPEEALDSAGPLPASLVRELAWTQAEPDVRGIVNLARIRPLRPDARGVLAGVTLRTDRDRSVRLRFGFSDRVTVYLGGRPVFRGADPWRSRDHRFLGTVGRFYELVLPLRRGENPLRFAVAEDFGGWGITARLLDTDGVEVLPR